MSDFPARRVRRRQRAGAAALLLGLAPFGSALAQGATAPQAGPVGDPTQCPWLNPTLPLATRVTLIMQKMTIADEINLVEGNGSNQPYVFYVAGNPSLCMPALGFEDGPGGVADGLKNVTQLPAGIALAATFSRTLALQYGSVIGAEQSVKGSAADLGPTVNIDRDPRWGRTFESLSEDPKLTAQIGAAEIEGIQAQRVMAQVKHFDAYNQETNRNTQADDVIVSDRVLHEIYEPAFETAIRDAGSASLMCAYSSVNGFYSCQNRSLLTGVLRNEYNFQGLVMSDYGAVHDVAAAQAGTDSEQPENTYFGVPLMDAVINNAIPRAVLNSMVEPIVAEAFRFGFFNAPPSGSTSAVATTPDHVAFASTLAEDGTVLLQNQGALLPLAASADVAVIGPAASTQVTTGGGGSAAVIPSAVTTPLDGIRAASTGSVTYAQGLPNDTQLASIPSGDLSAPYSGTPFAGSYSATLTAPETGTYVIGITNPCGCYTPTTLSINGTTIIDNPGTPPVSTYSASVTLTQGQTYTLAISGESGGLNWATPSQLQAYIAPAVQVAKSAQAAVVVVSDDAESEAMDRPSLSLPSAQDALIAAVAAVNPHTVVVVQAGAPVTMPWLGSVASVLDTWYPGQTSGTSLAAVLYGAANPSGHLPITFPASLADVPAATPAQFPGVGNTVQYSEGLLVGYRWYDAKSVKPLFPFGYGLSYAHFSYSGLQLQGSVDGVTPVKVSATVTNDGKVAGSDVAQLYLGFPAAAGEPPRKLVDFTRVTLAPGQSQRVSFTINPSDEWWWNGTAWDETSGTYQVYVGNSSALSDLTLTRSYAMNTSIGNRRVSVAAPRSFAPGQSGTVQVTLSAGGNQTLSQVSLALSAPGGWRVAPLAATTRSRLLPGNTVTVPFSVTPPAAAVTQNVTLYGTANFSPGACPASAGSTATADAQAANPAALFAQAAQGIVGCKAVARHGGVQVRLR